MNSNIKFILHTELHHQVVLQVHELLLQVHQALLLIFLYQILRFLQVFHVILDFVVQDYYVQPKEIIFLSKYFFQKKLTSAF
jgi:hypothetical protein